MRTGLAVAAVAVLLAGGTATAAPAKRVCGLVSDPMSDDNQAVSPLGYYDIVRADIATDPAMTTISATVRLRDLDLLLANGTNDTQVYWTVGAAVAGTPYRIELTTHTFTTLPGFGTTSDLWRIDAAGTRTLVTPGRALWNLDTAEIRMRVPADKLRANGIRLRRGLKLTALTASSSVLQQHMDDASSTATYTMPTLSCINAEQAFQ